MEVGMTNYSRAWNDPLNREYRALIRDRLSRNIATIVELQPGDCTRYRFLLVPEPRTFTISDGSPPDDRHSDPDVLLVSVLDGLGEGVASISADNEYEGIVYRIADKLNIRNPCTAEALARTIEAVWASSQRDD